MVPTQPGRVSVHRKDHGKYEVEFTKGDMTKSFLTGCT